MRPRLITAENIPSLGHERRYLGRASMRPRLITAENVQAAALPRQGGGPASMRPRLITAENVEMLDHVPPDPVRLQ